MNSYKKQLIETMVLKKSQYATLVKIIKEKTTELSSYEKTYDSMFSDFMWQSLVQLNNAQICTFFNSEKEKYIDKITKLKFELIEMEEMKQTRHIEYDGLICMYRIL